MPHGPASSTMTCKALFVRSEGRDAGSRESGGWLVPDSAGSQLSPIDEAGAAAAPSDARDLSVKWRSAQPRTRDLWQITRVILIALARQVDLRPSSPRSGHEENFRGACRYVVA